MPDDAYAVLVAAQRLVGDCRALMPTLWRLLHCGDAEIQASAAALWSEAVALHRAARQLIEEVQHA